MNLKKSTMMNNLGTSIDTLAKGGLVTSLLFGLATIAYADNLPSPATTTMSTVQNPASSAPLANATLAPVVMSGTVPDEGTKQALLNRLRELYGDRVVDQLKVGNVRTPPQWSQIAVSSIQPTLKGVTQGRLDILGANITLHGNVTSDATRIQLEKQLALGLPAAYTVNNKLDVVAQEQAIVDKALANRIIEFQSGSAVLTPAGQSILNEMAVALNKVGGRSVRIIGHTDDQGLPTSNLTLSLSRANAVKTYLIQKGLRAESFTAQGLGSTKPIADNATEEGRRRNRRIEFDVL